MSKIRVVVNYVDVANALNEAKVAVNRLENLFESYIKQPGTEFLNEKGEVVSYEKSH